MKMHAMELETTAAVQESFPDPLVSLSAYYPSLPNRSARLDKHYRRRAQIYSEARCLLAKVGHARFSVRRLADRCGLTTQSIYNIVGSRTQVIVDAFGDHTRTVLDEARKVKEGPSQILAITELYGWIARTRPTYLHCALSALFGAEPDVRRSLHHDGWRMRAVLLADLQQNHKVNQGMDCNLVAQQMARNGCASAHEWTLGFCSLEEHLRDARWGAASLLYHVLVPAERSQLEPILD